MSAASNSGEVKNAEKLTAEKLTAEKLTAEKLTVNVAFSAGTYCCLSRGGAQRRPVSKAPRPA